jgi:hypothetical protein
MSAHGIALKSLKEVQADAIDHHVRLALEHFGDVGRAAVQLHVHENTIRHYMKRAGITPEQVREWKEQRMRQRTIEYNGK